MKKKNMTSAGLEPTTLGLKVQCTTNCAMRSHLILTKNKSIFVNYHII